MPTKPRFPFYVIKAASVKATPSDDSPRELARARGANAANAWILATFDRAVEQPPASERCSQFMLSLPVVHARPNKLAFVEGLSKTVDAFEQHYRFDPTNGTAQVRAKDIPTNEAYGFYDRLNTLAERFDLWAVIEKKLR
jgi:hypothetical protein